MERAFFSSLVKFPGDLAEGDPAGTTDWRTSEKKDDA